MDCAPLTRPKYSRQVSGSIGEVLIAVSIPIGVAIAAGFVASQWPPGPRLTSALRHFAAGLIFAAVAVELLPDIHGAEPVAVVLGAAAGLSLMLGVKSLGDHLTPPQEDIRGRQASSGPLAWICSSTACCSG